MGELIDLHTRIFNVRFLAINGITVQWCHDLGFSESVAKRLAALLNVMAYAHSVCGPIPLKPVPASTTPG